jgi:hypothetical protein
MTDSMTWTQAELDVLTVRGLEEAVQAQLHHYFIEVQKIRGMENMMYDPTGRTAFVVVAFNNVQDHDMLPEEAPEDDKKVAISSSSACIMPEVQPNMETQTIGPHETIKHGVQAVAAAMLLSSLQRGAVQETMAMAQSVVLRQSKLT